MPEKTTSSLLNTALAQLEDIFAELESCEDLENAKAALTDFELDLINRESGADLPGFKKLEGLNEIIPPKK